MMEKSRQVRRAEDRHAAKIASSVARGLKYPEAKYRPDGATGKTYTANGARETARRAKEVV